MAWRDELGRVEITDASGAKKQVIGASFREVPFFVSSGDFSGGRRTATHEYPYRDQPYVEDLGRKARAFSIDGYVVGPTYIAARNALLTALEGFGPGELRHPYHGTRTVSVDSFAVRESSNEGGIATFTISFLETTARPVQPAATIAPDSQLLASALIARAAVAADFLATYRPGVLQVSLSDALRRAAGALGGALALTTRSEQEAAALVRQVDAVTAGAVSLASSPATLVDSLTAIFTGFSAGGFRAVLSVYGFDPGPRPPDTTANRKIERANFDALQQLTQCLAVVRAAELALNETFVNYEAATSARASITDLIDAQSTSAGDESYPALFRLRAAVTKAVPSESGALPRLRVVTTRETTPSLVLVYQLYGSLDLESDLLARNDVAHPAFVVGGTVLEVLGE